jgi:PAS domain S-box-containing protein
VKTEPTPGAAAASSRSMALPAGVDENLIFRSLFAANPDAHLVADGSGHIVLANPAACTMFGYANDELVGLNVDALVPDSIRPRHAAYRAGYAHQPRSRPMGTGMELVAKRRDGSVVMVEISLSPLMGQGSALVVAAIRSIADYPRVKQALQRARYGEHLAQLGRLAVDVRDTQVVLEQVTVIAAQAMQVESAFVYFIEPDNLHFRVVSRLNPTHHDVHADHADQILGSLIPNQLDTLPGYLMLPSLATNAEPAPAVVGNDHTTPAVVGNDHTTSAVVVNDHTTPAVVVNDHTTPAVVVTNYTTERRFKVPANHISAGWASGMAVALTDRGRVIGALTVASKEAKRFGDDEVRFLESLCNLLATSLQRAQSEEALSHAQRLESVGQLTGGIAHDFNNLLTVIQGNLQVLEALPEMTGHEWGQHLMASALRATHRGAELTGKLLAFSRRQMLQPRQVDLGALLESLADMLRRTVDQRIRIAVNVATDCPAVLVDPGQLESALLNLAINARDAMPEGGTLRFEAQACTDLPSQVKQELAGANGASNTANTGYVSVRVADSGAGMPDAVKERAFEPFFTTKELGRGTGLGLSTVYGFVKQSQGAITVDSTLGVGTTLTLYLPQAKEADASASDRTTSSQALPVGLKVLLVEDDIEVAAVAFTFLNTMGCIVTEAHTGEQAWRFLESGEHFDLLLTDIALGSGMRGTDLAVQAARLRPQLAVLLTSGFSSELIDADRDSPLSWALLPKPYTRQDLASAVALAMAQLA